MSALFYSDLKAPWRRRIAVDLKQLNKETTFFFVFSLVA